METAKPLTSSEVREVSEWISTTDRLPDVNRRVAVLVSDVYGQIRNCATVARRDVVHRGTKYEETWWWAGLPGKYHKLTSAEWIVTHWMPLPPLPQLAEERAESETFTANDTITVVATDSVAKVCPSKCSSCRKNDCGIGWHHAAATRGEILEPDAHHICSDCF